MGGAPAVEKERWEREDERRKKMMLTSGTRMSLRGECKYKEIYVFVYACSWAQTRLHTYFVAYLREVKNCNGKFQNT
jgi:hypothetical protein